MAEIVYNGSIVNSSVSDIASIKEKFSTLSSSIREATSQILSARGFQEYIGGISIDSFSNVVNECGNSVDELVNRIRQAQIEVLSYSENQDDVNSFLDTLNRNDYKSLDLSSIDSMIPLSRKVGNAFLGGVSTLATAGLGLAEGLMDFAETGADLVCLGGTMLASIFTKGYDLITGSDTTTEMWNETKAYVSDKKVESMFNSFYADTEIGQTIKNNAYGYDAVRGVGKGLGYTAGMIGLTILTGGIASGLGIGATGSISAAQLGATAGIMGFSKHTEDAWADGATTEKGLLYGAAGGAWEGIQWYAGAKINQFGGLGDQVANGIFKGAASGVGTRILMDTVDSGLEGFVQPALSMIYKDYNGASIVDKYTTAFESAGGWGNVLSQAAMGAIASAIGEYSGARRLLKESSNADSATKMTVSDGFDDGEKDIFGAYYKKNTSQDIDVNTKTMAFPDNWDVNSKDMFDSAVDIKESLEESTPELSPLLNENIGLNSKKSNAILLNDTLQKAESIFQAKYADPLNVYEFGKDYVFDLDDAGNVFVVWKDYNSYLRANSAALDNCVQIITADQRKIVRNYIGESIDNSYKPMNGIIRNNFLAYDDAGNVIGVNLYGLYSGKQFYDVDSYVAKCKDSLDDIINYNKKSILDLDEVIRNNPLEESMVTFRGLKDADAFKNVFGFDYTKMSDEEIVEAIINKKGFVTDGFFSTSVTDYSTPVAGSDVIYRLKNKAGTPALDLSRLGGSYSEQEVLIASHTPYRYTNVEIVNDFKKQIIITCEVDDSFDSSVARNLFKSRVNQNVDEMISSISGSKKISDITTAALSTPGHSKVASYISAPTFSSSDELMQYVKNKVSSGNVDYDELVGTINKHLDNTCAKSSFSSAMADELYQLYDLGLSDTDHSKVMTQVINSNHMLREQISAAADSELAYHLKSTFGITDPNVVKQYKDAILGDNFVDGSIGSGADWNKLITIGEDTFKQKVQQGIKSGKEAVLWSGFATETHPLMDDTFTTVANSTIGEMPFVETVYNNWNGQHSVYKAEDLWGKLSTTYAQAICEAEDSMGESLTSVKFLYPNNVNATESMGVLFKTKELPEIVSYESINTITMAKTNPLTMEIEDTVDIDITDLCEYYNSHSSGLDVSDDPALCEKIFEMFEKKVKEAFN